VTSEEFEQRLAWHMEKAKLEITQSVLMMGPESNDFVHTATLVLSNGKEREFALAFWDRRELATCMEVVSATCRDLSASALIIRSRALRLNTERIFSELEMPASDRPLRRAATWEWLRRNTTDGRSVSLRPDYRRECLLVVGLGPRLPNVGIVQYYDQSNHNMIFVGAPAFSFGFEFPLIRKWWQ
jgi:hypothetical protein